MLKIWVELLIALKDFCYSEAIASIATAAKPKTPESMKDVSHDITRTH